jgi:acetoin utilization protein AcuB
MRTHPIHEYMRILPQAIAHDLTLRSARQQMEKERCRHLPVMRDGRIAGMLSLHALDQVAALEHREIDRLVAADAMTEALLVEDATAVDLVAERMIERQVDAALVTHGDDVVGIFTTADALRLLRRLLGPVE